MCHIYSQGPYILLARWGSHKNIYLAKQIIIWQEKSAGKSVVIHIIIYVFKSNHKYVSFENFETSDML